LFDFNDDVTRGQFVGTVSPILRSVQGGRGISGFRVVCDETNNTADIIQERNFVGDIFVQPLQSINEVQLNFIAVDQTVSFEEAVG